MSKETAATIALALTVALTVAVFLVWQMVAPTWDEAKTWTALAGCLAIPAAISVIGAFIAFRAWEDDRHEARQEKQHRRRQRDVDLVGQAAQLAGYDANVTRMALGTLEGALRASMNTHQNQLRAEISELRRDRMLQPPTQPAPAQTGLIWSEDDFQSQNEEIVDGQFWI